MNERECPACESIITSGFKSYVKCKSCGKRFHQACLKGTWSWNCDSHWCALCSNLHLPISLEETDPAAAATGTDIANSLLEPPSATSLPLSEVTPRPRKRDLETRSPPSPLAAQPLKLVCSEKPISYSSSLRKMSDDQIPPPWFAAWVATGFEPAIKSMKEDLRDLSTRMTKLEEDSKSYHTELQSIRTNLQHRDECEILTDTCEIRISGIPDSFSNDYSSAVKKIFEITNNATDFTFIESIRGWTNKQGSANDAASSKNLISVVVRLVSPSVRNNVIGRSHLLKGKTAHNVFGTGGNSPISMRPLWPRTTYDLLRLAISKAKALNYLKPVVRNLVVCMRPDKDSQPILIRTASDLDNCHPRSVPR